MPDVLNLLPNAVAQPTTQTQYAQVSSHQPAPASFDDPLYVVFPHDPTRYWVINDWPAVNGNALPKPGASCLVMFDDLRNLWCVGWAGEYSPLMPAPFCNKLANFLLS